VSVLNLADYGRLRIMAERLGIESVDREGRTVVLKFRPQAKVDPVRLVALVRQRSDLTLVPPAALKVSLDAVQAPPPPPRPPVGKRSLKSQAAGAPSWWTARARAGEVTPGFTKQDILRKAADDPRAAGGLFERLDEVLSELLERV
jgi:hypothetical protein